MFIKYSSIHRSYEYEYIDKKLSRHPELKEAYYSITEKIHGANFSVWIYPDNTVRYAKRTGFLEQDESFFDWQNTVAHLNLESELINLIDDYTFNMSRDFPYVFFGELFGKGVQKGVDYDVKTPNGKDIKFFDVAFLEPPIPEADINKHFISYLCDQGINRIMRKSHLFVKSMHEVHGLEKALNYNAEFLSTYNPVDGNVCEGIVIKAFCIPGNINGGCPRLILKRTNDKFKEKASLKKRFADPLDPKIEKWREIFCGYLNENRVNSLWSKLGEMHEMAQIGEYVKALIIDAKEDFLKDHRKALEADYVDISKAIKCGKLAGKLVINKFKENWK